MERARDSMLRTIQIFGGEHHHKSVDKFTCTSMVYMYEKMRVDEEIRMHVRVCWE